MAAGKRLFSCCIHDVESHGGIADLFLTSCLGKQFRDFARIINAAGPRPAAGQLQRRPKSRVVRQRGIGREVASRTRGAKNFAPSSGVKNLPIPADQINVAMDSIPINRMRMTSPSKTLPIGPPARPSGPMWPMHAPVETPEKRASVSSATCLPNGNASARR